MDDRDRNKRLLDLLKLRENSECADCGCPEPDWASYKLGVFICLQCSGIHRNLPSITKVKSVRLDYWTDDLIQFMKDTGNQRATEIYEASVPPFYYRPRAKDCVVLKEQWVRAKYEREEFTSSRRSLDIYTTGHREGFLWKRGKDNGQFLKRMFILSEREGVVKYYTKQDSKVAKGIIPIKSLNAMFQEEKLGHVHGLEITYLKDGKTRSVFVYHENGMEIVAWFNALRVARFNYLKALFPAAAESELIPKITRNYSKAGYMEKTGPTQREAFKKRWFNLDSQERKLLYYKDPLDAFEQGGVFVGSKERGYQVLAGLPKGITRNRWKDGITIETPERNRSGQFPKNATEIKTRFLNREETETHWFSHPSPLIDIGHRGETGLMNLLKSNSLAWCRKQENSREC
ncbi:arf-GAP with dual PH domain-containing protein 2 isoform X3 [Ascaphus truei]|uniref:arf-GAP with dual PH domain-containing protein 2 isoform X3 n=1 Tax=Ascaphus truei TaxID=8439 RepID=UPI003F5A5330